MHRYKTLPGSHLYASVPVSHDKKFLHVTCYIQRDSIILCHFLRSTAVSNIRPILSEPVSCLFLMQF